MLTEFFFSKTSLSCYKSVNLHFLAFIPNLTVKNPSLKFLWHFCGNSDKMWFSIVLTRGITRLQVWRSYLSKNCLFVAFNFIPFIFYWLTQGLHWGPSDWMRILLDQLALDPDSLLIVLRIFRHHGSTEIQSGRWRYFATNNQLKPISRCGRDNQSHNPSGIES